MAAASLDQLPCEADDLEAVVTAVDWARHFVGSPQPDLGRRGPVCPFIRQSFEEQHLYVACSTEEECNSLELQATVRSFLPWFTDLQAETVAGQRKLVTIVIVLPRIDRATSEPLDLLHAELKSGFVAKGLMLGQFHPQCQAAGLWNPDFRPLQSPVPLLVIREMVASDLPFLVSDPMHANVYFERFGAQIPAHTREFLVDRLVATTDRARG